MDEVACAGCAGGRWDIWRRRNGSFGSVREILRVRFASALLLSMRLGGGWSEERRIGGLLRQRDGGQGAFRFGGVVGQSSCEAFFSSRLRSVEAKLRADGLSGGVDSPAVEGSTMVFLHRSHMPDV
jgi:hypothetical protein